MRLYTTFSTVPYLILCRVNGSLKEIVLQRSLTQIVLRNLFLSLWLVKDYFSLYCVYVYCYSCVIHFFLSFSVHLRHPCRPLAPTCVVVGIPMESYLLFRASFQILNTERKCAVGLRSAGIAALNDWLKNLTPLRDKKTEQFRGLSPCLNWNSFVLTQRNKRPSLTLNTNIAVNWNLFAGRTKVSASPLPQKVNMSCVISTNSFPYMQCS